MKKEEVGMKLVDMDTGQVFENVVKLTTHKQDEGLKKLRKMNKENKEFVNEYGYFFFKSDSKSVDKLEVLISNSDIAKLIYVATYLNYEGELKTDDGRPMTKSLLKTTVGVNENLFYEWYNLMIKTKVLKEIDNEVYMSEKYCLRGGISKNKSYSRVFIDPVRHIYTHNKGKNMSTIGHIFKLLPYINHHNNILCWNPKEKDRDKLSPITVRELLTQLGEYHKGVKGFRDIVSKYRMDNGEPLIVFFSEGGEASEELIMFNPRLSYSGNNDDLPNTYDIFRILGIQYNQINNQKLLPKLASNQVISTV